MKKIWIFIALLIPLLAPAQESDAYLMVADTTERFASIEEILELEAFQDKIVYIDIWGTTCKPCIKEFAYTSALKERFEGKDVVFLYLCSPVSLDPNRERVNIIKWTQMVDSYQLKPANVYISGECYEDGFWEKHKAQYDEDRMYGIPTYLIADRTGKIVNFEAPRPSKGETLYQEIEKWLK